MQKIFSGIHHPASIWRAMLAWLILLGLLQAISTPVFAYAAEPVARPILFIQEGIADRQTLIDGAGPEVDVVLLDARHDGLRQIADLLRQRRGVPALHLISHGAPGRLALGSSEIDTASLQQRQEDLATIGRALGSNADILLYGCEVAAGTQGRSFLAALASATGAQVAASTDVTGAAGLGGNWTLEGTTGSIHHATLAYPAYRHLLPSMAGTVSYTVAGARTVDPMFRNYGANNKSNSGASGAKYSMYFGNINGSIRNSGDTLLGYGTPLTLRSIDSALNVLLQQAFIIKNDDGLPFRMNSFLVLDNTHTNNPTLTATAYYNGVVKGTQTFTVPQGGTYSGTIVLNSLFNDVTEVRIDAGSGAQLRQWFNDFNFADPTLSTESHLDGLAPSQGTLSPVFASDWFDYTISVPNLPGTITLTPSVTDVGRASVTVNGVAVTSGSASSPIALAVGANVITTEVTAHAGGAPRVYTTTITRAVSANADLSALSTSAGTLSPAFAATTLAYTAAVPYTSSTLTVTPTLADSMATVKVNGVATTNATASASISLAVGVNHLSVLVTAPDGTTQKTYAIDVTRSGNADLSGLAASSGLAQTFAIATLAYTASVPNATTSMTVTPTTAYATSTIKVNGSTVASGAASGALPLAVGANVINVVVTAQDGTTATYALTVTRQASSIASLSALTVSTGTLSPAFGSATLAYSMTVPNAQTALTVTPTVTDANATVTANGTTVTSGAASVGLPLAVGANVINVVVTAQDGTTATYVLTVTRQGSSDAGLIVVTPSAGALSPVFSSTTLAYSMTVPNAQTTLTVTSIVADPTATIKVNGATVVSAAASGALSLAVGANVINIVVTAQDGTVATYVLTVTRQASSDASLSAMTVSAGTLSPVFGPATLAYSMTVPNAQTTLAVTPTVADPTATVKVNTVTVASGAASNALSLAVGANVINVVVTAQDGTTATYALTVTRQGSSNASLSAMTVSAGTLSPVFGTATLAYSMTVPNAQTTLAVTPTVADPTATIKVNGTTVASAAASSALSLAVGSNAINVVVTAQNGTTATYALTVTRQASANASLSALTTSTGTLSPVFGSATLAYSMTVPNAQTALTVTPTVADPTATIKVNTVTVASGAVSSALSLAVGSNAINVLVTAQDGTTATYALTVTRQASANASLSALSTSAGTLSPVFGSATLAYSMTVPNAQTTLTVTPTMADPTASIKVNTVTVASGAASSALPLAVGSNVINAVVTAQDGTTATYVLTVTRQASSNASLSAMTVSAGTLSPVFGSATLAYGMTVPNTQTTLAVTPTVADPTATIKVNGTTVASAAASSALSLAVGSNAINVVVTAQNGTTATYTLTVTRQASANASLSALSTSAGTLSPVFGSATLAYSMTVPNAQTALAVTPTVADPTATVKVNTVTVASGAASSALSLAVGSNAVNVVVTAQDGTTATYALTVTRQASSNASLSAMTVSAGTLSPVFGPATLAYSMTVPNAQTTLAVTPTMADPAASIKVNGATVSSGASSSALSLVVGGNVITIVVTAQDSSTATYTLNVTRQASGNASLSGLSTSTGVIGPSFNTATFVYAMTVPNSTTSFTLTPVVADPTATIKVNTVTVASAAASSALPLTVGSNVINVLVTAQDGSTATYALTVTRQASSDASLSAMTVSAGTLSPVFGPATLAYSMTVPNAQTTLTVTPTVADPTATIKVNTVTVASGAASSALSLAVGSNAINVVVTAQDGTTATYTLTVTRQASSNASLSAMTFSAGTLSPVFGSATLAYSMTVPNAQTTLTVTPTVADPTATIKVNGTTVASAAASSALSLAVGSNAINVVVTAQDGTTATYALTVTRQASANASLSALTTSTGTLSPGFGSATLAYSMTVPNAQTTLTVTPTVANPTATVKVNNVTVASGAVSSALSLAVGSNAVNVLVTAQDGTIATYTLTVTRQASANASLSALTTSTGTLSPAFGSATLAYSMTVPNTQTTLAVTPTVADPTATVKVNTVTVASGAASGALPLAVGGNTINVLVTAQDGTTTTYTLTVTRQASANASLSAMTVSAGTLSPVFGSATLAYSMTVPNAQTTLTVTPTVTDPTASIKVNGATVSSGVASAALPLAVSSNVINIVVTAQDGTAATYVLTVTRLPSTNASLGALTTSTGTLSPVFGSTTLAYSMTLPSSASSLTLTPVAVDSTATIKIAGNTVVSGAASAALPLVAGSNVINVVVTAQDSSTATYVLTVTRQASSNSSLSTLVSSVGTLSPTFGAATLAYAISVPNSNATLKLTPVAADAKATIRIDSNAVASGVASGALPLNVGSNLIHVVVTAEDNTSTTYMLTVTRQTSGNASLSALTSSAGALSPAFGAATLAYGLSLPAGTTSLTLTPTAADSMATIKVNGSTVASGAASNALPLALGSNVINVAVTAQDGSILSYVLSVMRQGSSNADLATLLPSTGSLSPAFSAATSDYTMTLPESTASIAMTASAADADATLSIQQVAAATTALSSGAAIPLAYGANTVIITVTAQDGTSKAYTIVVNRTAPSHNAKLATLTLSSGRLDNATITAATSYTATVSNTVTAMVLTPTLADTSATVKVNGKLVASGAASDPVPLAIGLNAIAIDVWAQDGVTVQHYTLNVTRPAAPAPVINTAPATAITASGATLNARVNANGADASVSFLYGATTTYGNTVALAMAPAAAGNIVRFTVLSDLRCNTIYHYTLQAINTAGASSGNDQQFTTAACAAGAPGTPVALADSEQASVTFAAAETNGSPVTGYLVTSSPTGATDSQAGSTALTHLMTGLKNGVAYTFTVVASNAGGAGPASPPSSSVTPVGAVLSGMVYQDDNDNGLNDPGESGIAGVTLTLEGVDRDARPVRLATVTAADGSYSFDNLKGGTYTLIETQPAGYLDGRKRVGNRGGQSGGNSDASANNNRIGPIVLERGQSGSGYLFGERTAGSLAGQVYVDANDNGVRDAGEAGLAGVHILLSGQTAGGADICSLLACSAVTGADGAYRFSGLPPGVYALTRNAADTDGAKYADGKETAGVAGGVVNNDNFGTLPYQLRIAAIEVTAAVQARNNGQLDGYLFGLRTRAVSELKLPVLSGTITLRRKSALDDGAVSGWSVVLMQNDKPVCTVLSNAQGQYRFDNLVCSEFRQSGLPTGSGFSISFSKAGSNVRAMPSSGGAAGTATRGVIRDLVLSGWDDIGQQDLPLDPEGIIYDAASRQPLAGAVIILTGPPGFDAERHLVGGAAVQIQTTGSDGMYQYLLQNGYPSGVYTLKVTQAPGGYTSVSALLPPCSGVLTIGPVPDPAYLQSNDGSPPTSTPLHDARACPGLVEGGARSTQYYLQLLITNGVSAPILNNHIPLDTAAAGALALSKSGDRQRAELGDTVRYSLVMKRSLGGAQRRMAVRDELPPGFRYIPGTATANGVKIADPAGSGSVLGFNLGLLSGDQQLVLGYRVRVGVGSMQGDGVNRARAYACADGGVCLDPATLAPAAGAVASNQASFKVQVDAGVFSNEACVVGKVFADCDGDGIQGANERGIPGVRLYLEDGTHITTDGDGKYSYCGLTPKTHVIKLDSATLPEGSVAGITGNRNLGDAGSVLLDLKNGELMRADFAERSCAAPVLEQIRSRRAQGASAVAGPRASPGVTFSSRPAGTGSRTADSVKAKSNEP